GVDSEALRASSSSIALAFSSSWLIPEVALRYSAMALPSARATSGSRLGPSTIRATVRMTSNSGMPMLNIDKERYCNRRGESKVPGRRFSWVASSVSGRYRKAPVKSETAPVPPARAAAARIPVVASEAPREKSFHRLRAALRFDGLWWRKLARLGCVHGPEWWR